jgi:hypothetical protein
LLFFRIPSPKRSVGGVSKRRPSPGSNTRFVLSLIYFIFILRCKFFYDGCNQFFRISDLVILVVVPGRLPPRPWRKSLMDRSWAQCMIAVRVALPSRTPIRMRTAVPEILIRVIQEISVVPKKIVRIECYHIFSLL